MIEVIRETHEAPEWVSRRLRIAGGINRYGEANYRAVWGWSRLTWIGGRWEDRDASGRLVREVVELRHLPKYTPHNRWHIERWCPPELYGGPAAWYAQTIEVDGARTIPALGPYPARGEYEHCFTLEGPRGEFVQLTASAAEYVARAIEFARALPPLARRAALDTRHSRDDRAWLAWAGDVLDIAL